METSAFADNGASSTQASTNTSFEYTQVYIIATLRLDIGLGHNNLIYLFYLQNNLFIIIYNHLYVFIYNHML